MTKKVVCLNRTISLVERDGLIEVEYECDPRYVQIVLTQLELDKPEVKGLTSPGVLDKNLEGDLVKLNSQDLASFRS